MRTQGGEGRPHAQERGLGKDQPCDPWISGRPASRTVREEHLRFLVTAARADWYIFHSGKFLVIISLTIASFSFSPHCLCRIVSLYFSYL